MKWRFIGDGLGCKDVFDEFELTLQITHINIQDEKN